MKRVLSVLAVALVVAAAPRLVRPDRSPPPDLVGRYVAVDGRHAGVAFEVTCDRVLLEQGEGFASHRIARVDAREAERATVYQLELRMPGPVRDRLRLSLPEDEPGVALLDGTDGRWMRAPDAPVPWAGAGLDRCE